MSQIHSQTNPPPNLLKIELENEVDISQLLRNLSLTPEQRALEHQAALETLEELRRAGEKLREKSQ